MMPKIKGKKMQRKGKNIYTGEGDVSVGVVFSFFLDNMTSEFHTIE